MKRLRWLGALVLLVGVIGSGGYAVAQARQPKASYSTATATRADVERTLDLSGTVAATGRRDLGFGTSGTVSRVAVTAGQRVRKGQVLARLVTTDFEADVTEAEATLAKAKAQLVSDKDAQADAVTASSTSSSSSNTSTRPRTGTSPSASPSANPKPDPALEQALSDLATQQQSVTTAQSAATDAITAAKAALAAQTQACEAATAGDSSDEDSDGAEGDGDDDTGPSAACTTALAAVQDAQDTVAGKQGDLQVALNSLSETLTKAVAALTKAAQSQSQSQSANNQGQNNLNNQNQSQSSADTGSADTGSDASGGTVTAARLAQDQADIDTADAQLGEARAARGLAILRAPYAGRVLQVGLAKGDQVSASDTPVVLVGKGVTTVTTTVSNAQVPDVRRGQSVTVTPAGWTSPMKGTVTGIAVLPDSSGNYVVTVTVESARTVSEGSTASVSIVTGVAKDAVTVPTSALTRNGTRAVVQVLDGQTVTRTSVTVGVVGTRRASITEGLKVGAKVVLADLSAKVPTSDNTNQNRFRDRGVELGGGPQVQFSRG